MKRREKTTSFVILTRRAVAEASREDLVRLLREEATWHDEDDSAMHALLMRAATEIENGDHK